MSSAPDDDRDISAQSTFTAKKHTASPFVFVGSKFVGRERRGSDDVYGSHDHCRIDMSGAKFELVFGYAS